MDALKSEYDAGTIRRRKIMADLNKVRPNMDRATMEADDFFAEHEALWADTAKFFPRK